jgi:hypothetical protein
VPAPLTSPSRSPFPYATFTTDTPVNRLAGRKSTSAFRVATPPSVPPPPPPLRRCGRRLPGITPRRGSPTACACSGTTWWGGVLDLLYPSPPPARTVVAPWTTPAMRCLRMWSSDAATWGRSVCGWASASVGGAACTRSTLPSFLFVPRSEIDCNFADDLFDFSSAERCYFHIDLCRASCSDRFARFFLYPACFSVDLSLAPGIVSSEFGCDAMG